MNEVTTKAPMGALTLPKLFANAKGVNDDLMAGVAVSFPILSIASKQWTVRWKGEDRVITLPPPHEDIAAPYVDVVILNTQKDLSRVYYKSLYAGGHERPDCWSSNGVKPDDSVVTPVNPVCGYLPNVGVGVWRYAHRAQGAGVRAAPQDRGIPYQNDLSNEAEGGPMLLSVPPSSLGNQRKYGADLKEMVLPDGTKDIPYYAVISRLSFEKNDAKGQPIKFPRIKFDCLRNAEGRPIFITEDEAEVVVAMRDGPAVKAIFDSKMNIDGGEVEANSESGNVSQVTPPKAAAPKTQAIPPKPSLVEEPSRAAARAVKRDMIDTSINDAIGKPAAPPPSARAVNTTPPTPKAMAPAQEEDTEAEATTSVEGMPTVESLMGEFNSLMERPIE